MRTSRRKREWPVTLTVAGITSAGALIGVGGCGAERKQDLPPQQIAGNPELSRGQLVFMHECNQCHPGGAAGLGPAINDKPLPAGMIKMQVREGLGTMPHFSPQHISDDDLSAVVAYLQARRQQKPLARS
jgi:mono/diheme cytochrome c family protein